MANVYDVGDSIRLAASFNIKNVLTDPSSVTLKVQDPSENEDSYTYGAAQITKDATGQYHKDITLDEVGTWYFRFEGTGAAVAAGEGNFEVRATEF